MEQFPKTSISTNFLLKFGIGSLSLGLIFGLIGSIQYMVPGFWKEIISFEKIRPLHVSSMVFWIILTSLGCVLAFVQEYAKQSLYSYLLFKIQNWLFGIAFILIMLSYFAGKFGGREYWEFPPIISVLIISAWILFAINFFKTIKDFKNLPVYVWMWMTGIFFFLFTFVESYLWVFSYFRNNIVNDITIQWKSYGSMVGAWNMLMYGSGLFIMDKIKGDSTYSKSKMAYLLYFTGLTNLMFNWGHHIYLLPTHTYIKHISYIISMSELFILGRIIYTWKSSVGEARKLYYSNSFKLLFCADIWVFINLILAIIMSVPAFNLYTHGTHITVAHTMGTTIGINTFLLMAFIYYIIQESKPLFITNEKGFTKSLIAINISLLVFFLSLVGAGIHKSYWQMQQHQSAFGDMMKGSHVYFIVMFIAGLGLTTSLLYFIYTYLFIGLASKKKE